MLSLAILSTLAEAVTTVVPHNIVETSECAPSILVVASISKTVRKTLHHDITRMPLLLNAKATGVFIDKKKYFFVKY